MDASAMARQHAPEAIAALVRGLKDPDKYISAATALLDRGFGRPAQHVTTETNGNVLHLHLMAAKAIAAELPMLDAKAETPVDTGNGLHLSVPDE